jgi:hypothetical protein
VFIDKVTKEGSPDFLPLAERIAVFDNEGSLWPENPMPFQAAFAIDELNRRILTETKLASDPMVQAAITGDSAKLLAGEPFDGLMQILALTHAGMMTEEFRDVVEAWSPSVRQPRFGRPYPVLTRTLDYLFVNDKEGKPVGIHQFIGPRPTICFGNSDGDLAMLQYTTTNNRRPSLVSSSTLPTVNATMPMTPRRRAPASWLKPTRRPPGAAGSLWT